MYHNSRSSAAKAMDSKSYWGDPRSIPAASVWLTDGDKKDTQQNYCSRKCPTLHVGRGVATAGDTGDASRVRPTMSPYVNNRQFVFGADFW